MSVGWCIRLLPVSIYDVERVEGYLGRMAEKGCFIKRMDPMPYFRKGEPGTSAYRLMPVCGGEAEAEEAARQGWEYVCTAACMFRVFSHPCRDGEAVKFPGTGDARGSAIGCLRDRIRCSRIIYPVLLAAFFMMAYAMLFNGWPVHTAIGSGAVPYSLCLFVYICFGCVRHMQDKAVLRRLVAGQAQEDPPPASWPWGEGLGACASYASHALGLLALVLAFASIFTMFYGMGAGWKGGLEEYQGYVPALRLSQVEQEPLLPGEDSQGDSLSFRWSVLAPAAYTVDESGRADDSVWGEDSSGHAASLHTEVYDLRFRGLAAPLAKELLEHEGRIREGSGEQFDAVTYQELKDTGFDRAIFVRGKGRQLFCGIYGKKLVFIRYDGNEDLKPWAESAYLTVKQMED